MTMEAAAAIDGPWSGGGGWGSSTSTGDLLCPHPEEFKADMAALFDLLREGAIHPVVVDRLPIAARARGP
jgi:hypothetical protein